MHSDKHPAIKRYGLFSKLVTHMPMIFYVLDINWKFLVSDGQGLYQIGLSPGQVIGLDAREMYKDYPDIIEAIAKAFKGQTVQGRHVLMGRHLENYVAPFYDESGNIEGIIGSTIDITERVQSEAELNKTRALQEVLFQSAPGIIYMYNENGELVSWNKSHEMITGYSHDELYKKKLFDWYPDDPQSQAAVMAGLSVMAEKGFGEAEANLRLKDGSCIPFHFTACPLTLNGQNYFAGMGMDISTRIAAQNELLELNRSLEDKVKERTQKLKSLNEELSAANEELTAMNEEMQTVNQALTASNEKLVSMHQFLVESEKMAALGRLVAGIAHEVNTPIGIGLTASSHLVDIADELSAIRKNRPLTDDDIASYMEDIDKASKIILKNLNRAATLIQSFKKLSVDQSTEPKRSFALKAYIDEVLLSLSPSIKKTQIKISVRCPEEIMMNAYPGAIAQIITNLVMNSIKHAFLPGAAGNICIEISKAGPLVQIIYTDDGCGMDENTVGKIFDPFFTTNRASGGTGLGLSIVYSIVTQQYMGSIKCTSEKGKGTTFTIFIKEDV